MRLTTKIVPWFTVAALGAVLGVVLIVGGCGNEKKSGDAGVGTGGKSGTGGATAGTGGKGTGGTAGGTAGAAGSGKTGGAGGGGGAVGTAGAGGAKDGGVTDALLIPDLGGLIPDALNLGDLNLDGFSLDGFSLDAIGACAPGTATGVTCSPILSGCLLSSGGTGCFCAGTWTCR